LHADALAAPVTAVLFAASIAMCLYTDFGKDQQRFEQFAIAGPAELLALHWDVWGDIRAGQVWRLFTPILLHFHPLHLLFNLFALGDMGLPSERFQGSWRYALFVLWSAAVSNVAQVVFGQSIQFGGLSGVAYALVGYLWLRGRCDPASGIRLPTAGLVYALGWLVLGFTGLLNLGGMGMANYAHLGGFAAGALYGYIAAVLARVRARS
jgi:GlpG protein